MTRQPVRIDDLGSLSSKQAAARGRGKAGKADAWYVSVRSGWSVGNNNDGMMRSSTSK
jgi:hypothetical protein